MRKLIVPSLAAAVAASLTVSHSSRAASSGPPPSAQCSKGADGSGSCWGTLDGFRALPAYTGFSGDGLSFYNYSWSASSNMGGFWARYNNVWYSCSVSNPGALWWQTASLSTNELFNIQWNSSGQCTMFNTQNTSFN